MSSLHFDARIAHEQLIKDVQNINKTISGWTKHVQREAQTVDNTFNRLGGIVAGYFSLNFAGNFVKQIAMVRGEFQQLDVAFETMIGNKAKSDALMAQVVEFASTTPFELKDVAGASKMLLAYGTAVEEIIPTLRSLGDVSAGLSIPIERLILNYGQVRMQAKLTGKELRDFAVMGVPLVSELAKNLNKTEQEITEMVSAGRIGFKEVEEAFKSMSGESGRFSNLMEKQSATITGLVSNLQDAWTKMLNNIGQANEGSITTVISTAKTLVENYQTVIDVLKVLVATYGTYKAALITTMVIQKAAAWGDSLRLMMMFRKELGLVNAAQQAFNLSVKANPYVLAATAIVGIVTAFVAFGKGAKEATDKSSAFREELSKETKSLNDAFNALKNAKQGTDQHKNAIQAINEKYGQYLPKLLDEKTGLEEIAKAQRDVTKAIIETVAARNKEASVEPLVQNLNKQTSKYNEVLSKVTAGMSDVLTAQTEAYVDNYLQQITEKITQGTDVTLTEVKQGLQGLYKDLTDQTLPLGEFTDLATRMRVVAYASKELTREQGSLDTQMREYIKTIKELSSEYDENGQVSIETITELIQRTQSELATAKKKLEDLRKGDAAADEDAINETIEKIGQLEKKLETLTGISRKANQELAKSEQERLNAYQDYLDRMVSLTMEAEAKKVALLDEGAEKQRQQAELAYQQEIQQIEKQRKDSLELYNKGLKLGQPQVTELPPDIEKKYGELRELAEKQRAQRIEQINKEAAQKINDIWKQATDFFLSEQEREVNAVNDKYNQLIGAAQKMGDNDLVAQLQKTRTAELEKIDRDFAIKRIETQADVVQYLQQQAELEVVFNRKKYIELLNLALEYQKAILNMKLSDPGVSEADIKELETRVKSIQKTITDFKKGSKAEMFSLISDVTGFLGEYNQVFKELSGLTSGIGKIIAGDIRGAFEIVRSVINLIELQGKKEEERQKAQLEALKSYISNIDLVFGQIEKSITRAFGTQKLNEFRKGIQALGNDLTWAISEINRLAKATLILPDKDAIIGYRDVITGSGRERERSPLMGYSLQSIEYAISENEKRIKLLILQYANTGSEQVKEILQAYEKYVDQLYSFKEQYQQILTGTTPDDIASAIIDGFSQGKRAAKDFADTFEDMIRQALISAMRLQVLEGPLNEFYADFAKSLEDGQLTPDEVAELRQTYNSIIKAADDWQKSIQDITGISPFGDPARPEGMKGAIKSLTEETGSLIAGQFYAFRELQQKVYELMMRHSDIFNEQLKVSNSSLNVQTQHLETARMQLDGINQSVTHLAAIERNTKHNEKLISIDNRLSDLNNYLKAMI
jgi:tape measure domain-containing protein